MSKLDFKSCIMLYGCIQHGRVVLSFGEIQSVAVFFGIMTASDFLDFN